MRGIVGNGTFVKFGLVPVILSLVALGGHGTPAAIIWDSPVIIVDEKVVTCCPPPMAQRENQTRQQPAEAQRRREPRQAKEERERAGILSGKIDDLSGKIDDLLKAVAAAQRENRVLQERAETGRRQAEAERERLQVETQKERRLAEAQHKLQQAQAEEDRKKAEILSRKVDGLLQVVAAAQSENRVLQERAEAQHRLQQAQAEEDRKRADILSDKVDGLFKAVATAQHEKRAQQERAETERRQAEAERKRKRQTDTALLEAVATARSGTRNSSFFVLGGLVVVIAAVWYITRSMRGRVEKVDGPSEVVTTAAKGDLAGEVGGDRKLDELSATIKEMLEEVSKRNRADERYQAAMPDSLI